MEVLSHKTGYILKNFWAKINFFLEKKIFITYLHIYLYGTNLSINLSF